MENRKTRLREAMEYIIDLDNSVMGGVGYDAEKECLATLRELVEQAQATPDINMRWQIRIDENAQWVACKWNGHEWLDFYGPFYGFDGAYPWIKANQNYGRIL